MQAMDLEEAMQNYLLWMISSGYSQRTWKRYERALNGFRVFVKQRKSAWNTIFTLATLNDFENEFELPDSSHAIRGFSRYLFHQKRIRMPIPKNDVRCLPDIYEEYLDYYKKSRQVHDRRIRHIKRVLGAFHDYLEKKEMNLSALNIEQIDAFFAEFNSGFTLSTCRTYRSFLRGFLNYLYHERKIIKTNLAPLVVEGTVFGMSKPPKFFRPHEIQKMFDSVDYTTPTGLLTCAMLQLSYTLGLRPKEICLITLDDIAFSKCEISINARKGDNSIKLPLPENAVKAIAAYIIGARPQNEHRTLFLSLMAPYGPITSTIVSHHLKNLMRKANLPGTAYWLRHTYGQNLLEAGVSIYEIKEMMGHDTIESTRQYLHVHIKLMLEVLFDETF